MKALVIYSSKFGNTEKIARTVADTLGNGVKAVRVNECTRDMIDRAKVLVIGSPTQMLNPTISILFLVWLRLTPRQLSRVKAAAFDTSLPDEKAGAAAAKIDKRLRNKGTFMLSPPKQFFVKDMKGPLVEGEIEKAKQWALELKSAYRVMSRQNAA